MKRTTLKVLISASIILSMIPFLFNNVYAISSTTYFGKVYSTSIIGSTRYDYIDYFFSAPKLVNGTLTITANNNFVFDRTQAAYNFVVEETDGQITVVPSVSTSNNAVKTVYTITYENCASFHVRLWFTTNTTFYPSTDTRSIAGKYGATENNNVSGYTAIPANEPLQLYKILQAIENISISGGSVDLSGIEDMLNDLLVTMDIQLGYQYDINTKLDIIINQLQTQQGTPSQDSIDDNTQAIEDLQTEVDSYDLIEQDITTDFNDSLEDINVNQWEQQIQGWTNGITWLKTQMNNLYNSMGDFKHLLEFTMVLAIALIFIGR